MKVRACSPVLFIVALLFGVAWSAAEEDNVDPEVQSAIERLRTVETPVSYGGFNRQMTGLPSVLAFATLGNKATKPLLAELQRAAAANDKRVATKALDALALVHDPASCQPLLSLALNDEVDAEIRCSAVATLGKVGARADDLAKLGATARKEGADLRVAIAINFAGPLEDAGLLKILIYELPKEPPKESAALWRALEILFALKKWTGQKLELDHDQWARWYTEHADRLHWSHDKQRFVTVAFDPRRPTAHREPPPAAPRPPWPLAAGAGAAGVLLGFAAAVLLFRRRRA